MTDLEKLCSRVKETADCAIITDGINRRYFTSMKSSAGTLVVFPEKAYFIIDFRYIQKARKVVKACEVILQDKLYEQINSLLEKHSAKTVAINADTCTLTELISFQNKLNAEVIADTKLADIITNIRMIKSQEQIYKIIAAQRIAEKGFEHMLDFIKVGRTEKEIQLELDYFMLRNGAEALSFDTIALTGANTSLPHGVPSDQKVKDGDFVLMDFGATYDGWHSDMTRTVCVGKPSEKMKAVYNTVLTAQLTALDAVKAGMSGKELDKIARDIITDAGYGDNFGHSLGHGVGVEIHESPYASPSREDILPANSIVTVEPGIYLEGEFGVRIEDFVIVTEDGCINMTKAPKELICL